LNAGVDVKPLPGLEHLPYAEVWLHAPDEGLWRRASAAAREIGKDGLEVWTTDATPEVAPFLEAHGYTLHRRYLISELDVAAAPDPGPPAVDLTTLSERPDLAPALYDVARESYPDQPGRSETRFPDLDDWRVWGLDPHDPTAYFIALDGDRVRAYGYLEVEGDMAKHGFMAVARDARGQGLAGAIKRAQIAWAKAHGLRSLRTANELRLEQMLALNRKLGYQALYTELVLRGPAADETK
jgi:GNAT superfamily N-acetyltransferase